ncbi:seed maturation protein [Trifolium pratense]|uniref:Seed maturation protein n=1 Tax=Trifolium pratense TaxID=57577 RepID=A0A2K3MTN6_TRIPR|nr:seed maturation protein [Trifolium pratense]
MEKLKNKASAAKEQADIYKAKIEEKAEKARARTKEEKVIAHERAKAKEAKAKMELHEAKAEHAAEKLSAKQSHYYGHNEPPVGVHQPQMVGNQPLGSIPKPGTTAPTYPLGGGNLPRNNQI